MRWLFNFLDHFYKNIYKISLWIGCFLLLVAFVAISAQYIGDTLSKKVLNNKKVVIHVVYDDDLQNNALLDDLLKNFQQNERLKELKVRFKKTKMNDKIFQNGKFEIILTKNEEFIKKLADKHKLAILDDNIFTSYVRPFVVFSHYHEYAEIETMIGVKIYIAYASGLKNVENAKVLKTFNYLNDIVFKSTGFGTEL